MASDPRMASNAVIDGMRAADEHMRLLHDERLTTVPLSPSNRRDVEKCLWPFAYMSGRRPHSRLLAAISDDGRSPSRQGMAIRA